jgi:hypothetical protein
VICVVVVCYLVRASAVDLLFRLFKGEKDSY